MKDPTNSIKRVIFTTLGATFTVAGQTVHTYANAPQSPANDYVWQALVGLADMGPKDEFVLEVEYEITCVTKRQVPDNTSVQCDLIAVQVLGALVARGTSLSDPAGDYAFLSVQLIGMSNGAEIKGSVSVVWKKLLLLFKVQEI